MRDLVGDEKKGANASLGFTYQHWWAALLAVEKFGEMSDYLISLEFKEDVALVDSSTAPTRVEFYQVKKNEQSGVWQMNHLLAADVTQSGKPVLSTISKLSRRRLDFHPHPTELWFVSNVGFKLPLEENATDRLSHDAVLTDLCVSGLAKIRKEIAGQLNVDELELNFNDFHLLRTGLPVEDSHRFVAGAVSELSDAKKLPFAIRKPVLCARILASEFARVGGRTTYAKNFKQLQKRSVSRSQIAQLLAQVEGFEQEGNQELLRKSITRLNNEAHDFDIVEAIEAEIVQVCTDLTDRTDIGLRGVCIALVAARDYLRGKGNKYGKLGEYMEAVVLAAEKENKHACARYTLGFLNCLALLVIKNAADIAIFTTASSAQQEAKE
ncbi:dsDNA nuclease domain-containing protein [Ralstonia solanacearum]|uniref:dsDNA nuclease domain-containing protein n=1 Tax=Ralstonia solanacearum TaxID=305 RepID=UPI0018D19FCD|nr:dsDNA nuclease domain-containing protein [Ralstonia solanacearum]